MTKAKTPHRRQPVWGEMFGGVQQADYAHLQNSVQQQFRRTQKMQLLRAMDRVMPELYPGKSVPLTREVLQAVHDHPKCTKVAREIIRRKLLEEQPSDAS